MTPKRTGKAADALSIVVATSEIDPFSKVGGLADVMGALPDALESLGCRIAIFTPLYSAIDWRRFGILPLEGIPELSVPVAGRREAFRLQWALKPGTGIKVYFIENERFYARAGIYTVPETGRAFPDEDERTIFFNRAVVAAVKALGIVPDVIHCNDFHTGLIPAYLHFEESSHPALQGAGTVYSIHNLAYQGIFPPEFLDKAGIRRAAFVPLGPFEFWGKVNVMKAGIAYSGIISTVSRTYAEEITTTDEYGYGLEGVLRARKEDLIGIPNGIDPAVWDPATDELIIHRFTPTALAGKGRNKLELLKLFGLPAEPDYPLIGMVSRLVDQKGFDILASAFGRLMELGCRFVILGTGQQKYHELYAALAQKHRGRLGLKLEFNNRLAHLIEAGSDFFLMPSRYEPCGLNQMYSLRYGTIPIVRATGGLKDTISDLDALGTRGNGFTFQEYSAGALIGAVRRAVAFHVNKTALRTVRKRIMKEDHSWRRSASEYMEMYRLARERQGIGLTK